MVGAIATTVALVLVGMTGCGGSGSDTEMEAVQGRVDGPIAEAVVCADALADGRCSEGGPQTTTDTEGRYALSVPKGAALVVEVIAGRSRAAGQPVDRSYRLATPAAAYSTTITPMTTLVHLTGIPDWAVSQDVAVGIVGLPPRYDISPAAVAQPTALHAAVSNSLVEALKASGSRVAGDGSSLAGIVASFPPALARLPELRIATKDAAPIVSKEVYLDATFELTNPILSDAPTMLKGKIRGRGNTTWGQPKNPYKVQFTNDAAFSSMPDVLGMAKNRNWALLADYFDKSLMRNKLALSMGNGVLFRDGLKWTPSGQHVEVFLNGDYVGVYLLTEDIRIDPARLAIRKMSDAPEDGELDGGYIVEADHRLDCYRGPELDLSLITPQGVEFCVDTPDEDAITPAQLAYVKAMLTDVEARLYGPKSLEGIDAPSFADAYLLQELFRNNDAVFFSSVFLWKDTDSAAAPRDRLLNMGPLWDFDRSAGNVAGNDNWLTEGCWVRRGNGPNWFAALLDNPDFLALTLSRWHQKRAALQGFVNGSIDAYQRRLAAAQQRNFERWPILGVPMIGYYTFATHAEEVTFLRSYLNERMAWMDSALRNAETFAQLCR